MKSVFLVADAVN